MWLQDNLKEEEKLKKELRLRMAYAGFLQETVTAMAVKRKTRYTSWQGAVGNISTELKLMSCVSYQDRECVQ